MNFCSKCGSAKLELKIPDGDTRNRFVCANCHTIHYQNPKIVAGCLPVWEGQVLLCKRAIEPRKGYWNIPAGFLENKETVEQGALREVWEEAEAKVDLKGILSIYSIPRISQIYILFYGDLVGGKFGVGIESEDTQLFKEADIPWGNIAFPSSEFGLKKFFENRKNKHYVPHLGAFIFET